jgi:hypothetical protein
MSKGKPPVAAELQTGLPSRLKQAVVPSMATVTTALASVW